MGTKLSAEEIFLLQSLGVKVKQNELPREKVKVGSKVYKITTTCVLCGTVATQYIRMARFQGESWEKEAEISEAEIGTDVVESLKEKVKMCFCCKAFLLMKDKDFLVDLVIKLYCGIDGRKK